LEAPEYQTNKDDNRANEHKPGKHNRQGFATFVAYGKPIRIVVIAKGTNEEISDDPYAQTTDGEDHQDARADFSLIKAVEAQTSKETAQQHDDVSILG
jgi:hypothetical protein